MRLRIIWNKLRFFKNLLLLKDCATNHLGYNRYRGHYGKEEEKFKATDAKYTHPADFIYLYRCAYHTFDGAGVSC